MSEAGRTEDLEARLAALEEDPIAVARRARADAKLRRIADERSAAADQFARTEARIAELEEEIVAAKRAAEEAETAYAEARDLRDERNDHHGRLLYQEAELRQQAKDLKGRIAAVGETERALRTGGVA